MQDYQGNSWDTDASRQPSQASTSARPAGTDGDIAGRTAKRNKRARKVESCTECRRRKIKCDRCQPCENCVKRVDALSCIFEGESPVESQPFALDSAFRRLRAQHDALAARFDILQSFFVDQYGASHPQLLGALELAATSGADVQSSASAPNVTADNGLEDMTFESPEDPVNVLSNVLDGSTPIADAGIPSGHTTVYRDPALYETYTGLFSIDEVLARILNLMPRRDVAKVLITRLLSPEEVFLYGTFIEHIFLKDVDEFWRYIEAGDIKSVDPAMIACVLEAVAGGVELVALDMVDVCGIPMANLEALQPQWRRAASQALELADWMNVPSYRCLQYCLLRGHPGLSNGSRPFYHAYAVRLARSMGFHKLGTDQMKMPPNSPGLPSGVCASKRQLACRAWATLYSIDVESSLGTGDWLIKSDSSKNATAPPLNVADADIGSQIVLQPRSMEDLVQGGCSALRLRYAVDMRKFVDGVIGLADAPDMPTAYARIRQIDAQFRDSVGRFNHLTALSRSPHLRNGLVSAFHYWLTRLHRVFAARGLVDPRYSLSTRTCIDSARICVQMAHEYRSSKYLWALVHGLDGLIVLYQHVWLTMDRPGALFTLNELNTATTDILTAFEVFKSSRKAEHGRAAAQASRAVLGLQQAVCDRIALGDNGSVEPFSTLIKRIGHNVVSSASTSDTSAIPFDDFPSHFFADLAAIPSDSITESAPAFDWTLLLEQSCM